MLRVDFVTLTQCMNFLKDMIPSLEKDPALWREAEFPFKKIKRECDRLGLPVSAEKAWHIAQADVSVAISIAGVAGQVKDLLSCLEIELRSQFFFFVEPTRRLYFWDADEDYGREPFFDSAITDAFPLASKDLVEAGIAYALHLNTASVFHVMRACEHALRAMAAKLKVKHERQQWHTIIQNTEARIRAIGSKKKTARRAKDLGFYAEAASQFYYLKEAFRNHVSHSRASYDETQALGVLNHGSDFLKILAIGGLKEI